VFQIKSKSSLKTALLVGAATATALSISAPARADSTVETVVVTGSRIPQQGLYSTSPVTAVGQQEMKLEGTTNVETLLNNLPAAFADFTDTASNGATGQATVDLRDLGSARTLVLVDGTRLMPSDPANPVADLNQIPAALVDHVEVLTGGASAVYGSDAEAGVVNFIMRKDFQGVEFTGTFSMDEADNSDPASHTRITPFVATPGFAYAPKDWWGGATVDATMIVGANTANGKGNVTAYVSYRSTEAVLESKRDFSACSVSSTPKANAVNHVCAGSANFKLFQSIDDYFAGTNYNFFENGTGAVGTGSFVPYTGATTQKFNYGALNYLQRPDTRYSGGFFGHYEVSPVADLYADFMFSDDHTIAQIAPSGLFDGTGLFPAIPGTAGSGYVHINCDNPFLTATEQTALCGTGSALSNAQLNVFGTPCTPVGVTGNCNTIPGQATALIGRRDIEGGNRIDDLRHTAYRMKIGVRGELSEGWNYDVYAQYGATIYNENYSNELSVSRVQNALEVTPGGQCVAINVDPACVPLDIFNGIGSITPAMLNYVRAQGFKTGQTTEQIVSGSVTGDLTSWGLQSPWAKTGVGIALGAEYRAEGVVLDTSRDFQLNDLYGQGSATLPIPRNGFNVEEGFGEIRVPIIQDAPLVEDLTFNGGFRHSTYSTAGSVDSYEYGLKWQVTDDFNLRGSVQHAVRAPNVNELFAPQNNVLFGGNDPCAAGASAVVITNCHAHGVPNAGSGLLTCPAAQCKVLVGGNVNVVPETSDTKSFGIVLTPTFFEGFTATVDYFDINVDNAIGAVGPQTILNACYSASATAASQAAACPLVAPFRNPATHSITGSGYVFGENINTGFVKTDGLDFEANYQADLGDWGMTGAGSLAFAFVGTDLQSLVTETLTGLPTVDCAGLYGASCGTPAPKWRHKLRVTWTTPWDFDLSLNWRHLGEVGLDQNTTQTLLAGIHDPVDAVIPAFDYFDLSGTWDVSEGLSLNGGVNNLFDKTPPVVDSNTFSIAGPPFGNGNTFPGVYDSLGRTLFLTLTAKY
jgi:outer membrane receptor protein involved in Fe transport